MQDAKRYMLDTNTASYIIKGKPLVVSKHLQLVPMERVCISVITEAELLLGLAKKPQAQQLAILVKEFLRRVEVLPWHSQAAKAYAALRAACEQQGRSLGNMDMLIAAQAKAENAVLVTNDKVFYGLDDLLALVDWTKPVPGCDGGL